MPNHRRKCISGRHRGSGLRGSKSWHGNLKLLDLGPATYVLYGVKYIDLVSLDGAVQFPSNLCPILTEVLINIKLVTSIIYLYL